MTDNRFTAVIVDDELAAIEYLSGLLKSWEQINILGTFTNPEDAIDNILIDKPDILFLDIQMPGKSGFDVIQSVRSDSYNPQIIFTTGFESFAIRAVRYAAFDYLLKPVNNKKLGKVIERIQSIGRKDDIPLKIDKLFEKLKTSQKLKFNTGTGFIVIDPQEIIYCEADGNYCWIHLIDDRNELVTCNMNKVGNLLPETDFFRASRFNIINLNLLEKVERKKHTCYLKAEGNMFEIKISPRNLKLLEKQYSI